MRRIRFAATLLLAALGPVAATATARGQESDNGCNVNSSDAAHGFQVNASHESSANNGCSQSFQRFLSAENLEM